MKIKASTGRKLRYGGMSALLTALIIAAVILVNVIFSALSQKFLWYADLTPELLFTASDDALDIIENGDDEFDTLSPIEMVDKMREERLAADSSFDPSSLMINIIFCDDPDNIDANSAQKYVHFTALELEEKFPDHINVEYYNIIRNPSSVSRFKINSLSQIYTTSVIVEFVTEYRIHEMKSFFVFNETDSETPWAYKGERAFVASILAVTRVESPVACITTNHGEAFTDYELATTLVEAGYIVQELDLAAQEILRLIDGKETVYHIMNAVPPTLADVMLALNKDTSIIETQEYYGVLADKWMQLDDGLWAVVADTVRSNATSGKINITNHITTEALKRAGFQQEPVDVETVLKEFWRGE